MFYGKGKLVYYSRTNITGTTALFYHKEFDSLEGAMIGLSTILGNHQRAMSITWLSDHLPVRVRSLNHLELPGVRERISILNKEPCGTPLTEIRKQLKSKKQNTVTFVVLDTNE